MKTFLAAAILAHSSAAPTMWTPLSIAVCKPSPVTAVVEGHGAHRDELRVSINADRVQLDLNWEPKRLQQALTDNGNPSEYLLMYRKDRLYLCLDPQVLSAVYTVVTSSREQGIRVNEANFDLYSIAVHKGIEAILTDAITKGKARTIKPK